MCYSVEVEKELKRIAKRFQTEMSLEHETWYEEMRKRAEDKDFLKQTLALKRKPTSNFFKEPGIDHRIYPGYFTKVIIEENGRREFRNMRYRVRPSGSASEIPSKYNVFNARIDSLETRQTWKKVFGKKHGLLPFTRFFEWVERDGKKAMISFSPQGRDIMWAPCLYDYWENKNGFGFYSFAIVTDDPPEEVSIMGHDRCPIFLSEQKIGNWLNPSKLTEAELYETLRFKEITTYEYAWAA